MKRLLYMTEPELAKVMNNAATAVVRELPPKSLFVLLAFDDPKVAQYISNCQRADVIKALREAADRLEKKEDVER